MNVIDSKEHPVQSAPVEIVEWSSGRIIGEGRTDESGSIRFDFTFGRYKARSYNSEETVVLNETVVDLIKDQFYLNLHSKISNLDLSINVVDSLGQPIPNALVKIERNGIEVLNLTTGSDGTASEYGFLGGYCRVSLFVAGKLNVIKSLSLDDSGEISLQVGDYIMLAGYPLELNQLVAGVSLAIVAGAFLVFALTCRRRSNEA
jgi:hypothetical protein